MLDVPARQNPPYIIKHVQGEDNPSPKIVTFKINADFLGVFEKITIPKSSRLVEYSPFAQGIFGRGGDLNRIDLFAKDGETSISIARKLMPWSEQDIVKIKAIIEGFFRTKMDLIYVAAMQKDFQSRPTFNPGGHPAKKLVQQSFFDQVNPVLASDGGAMELLNVHVKTDGEITSEVALLGSCNGCTSAEKSTLEKATAKIREVLDFVKEQNKGNPAVAALHFKEIKIVQVSELILTK